MRLKSRGMPIEFIQQSQPAESSSDTARLSMMYDGSGRRISKTFLTKSATAASWDTVKVTHYTDIGTEVREEFHNGTREKVNVVVNMPQGLGCYKVADASQPADDNASRTFEWYLKNHLGSTMLVYGTVSSTDPNTADIGETKAAYDYRAFGEMVTLSQPSDKVTENFTGKEHDEEIKLNYFGARYLDPMLGMWISVDPARQFASPYLYAGNGMNPVNGVDPDGNKVHGTFNRSTYQVVLTDDNPARGSRTFYAVSGYHSRPLERGGIIPVGKYEIFERVGDQNWFSLLWEGPDGKYYDIFRPKEGDKVGKDARGTFRLHRYHRGTNGCLSVVEKVDDPDDDFHFKHISEDDYNKLFEWIKGTETGSKNDSEGNERIDYGDIEVFGTPAPDGIETID